MLCIVEQLCGQAQANATFCRLRHERTHAQRPAWTLEEHGRLRLRQPAAEKTIDRTAIPADLGQLARTLPLRCRRNACGLPRWREIGIAIASMQIDFVAQKIAKRDGELSE